MTWMRLHGVGAQGRRVVSVAAAALVCAGLVTAANGEELTEDDVTSAVRAIIAERSDNGVFTLEDARTGRTLSLVMEDVRAVRGLPEFGWFPDIIFRDKEAPAKKYAIDFWLKPRGDTLALMDVQVHKGPVPDGETWMMITRRPLLWWWLPTLKRASTVKGMQAWQVMGRIHEHIVAAREDGAFPIKLESGKTIPAHLLAIHQPVGRTQENGRYFACASLRKKGNGATLYAVDFWLDPNAGSVVIGNARSYENPRADAGKATPRSHCNFEGITFDVVE